MKSGELLIRYLKDRYRIILGFMTFFMVFTLTAWIYGDIAAPIVYALEIAVFLELVYGTVDFIRYRNKHNQLNEISENTTACAERLPEPENLIESDYHRIISALYDILMKTRSEYDVRHEEMIDYYTLWAHQIKTPISALRLLLQAPVKDEKNAAAMELELFKIEQYTEMVLGYLRSESLSSDLVLKSYSVDEMVRQAVKKYAILFIGRKISLDLGKLSYQVVTDEKWFAFVIEQILSNALKYTPENGRVAIFMEGPVLVIEDTGIGILPEDLPRIFDRGFTGNNGRAFKKSTGIGLYLCKRILSALNHEIKAESAVGKGTRFLINLAQNEHLTKM